MVLTCRIAWCLTACKKSSSYLPSYLRYCKDIANLLFWVLWACQAMTSKNNIPACRKLWCSSSGKKIIFTFDLFLEILQIYHKLAILGTLGFDCFLNFECHLNLQQLRIMLLYFAILTLVCNDNDPRQGKPKIKGVFAIVYFL